MIEPDGVLIDRSSAGLLDVGGPGEIEINGRRAHIVAEVSGYTSFLGCPYVFTSYAAAARYIRSQRDDPMYILVRLQDGYRAEEVKRQLQARLPQVDVLTRAEFKLHSQVYWALQSGAGTVIMAAILGFLVGLVIVSQTIYATTMENLEEFATLKALGATLWYIVRVVLVQALVCGAIGCALGLAATFLLVRNAQQAIPWIETPWWLPTGMIGPSLLMFAAVISIRAALNVEPARVFRA